MPATSLNLLERLRGPRDDEAWFAFVELYSPLIYGWAVRTGLSDADAREVTQEVLSAAFVQIPNTEFPERKGSFRGWLKSIAKHKAADICRRRGREVPPASGWLDQVADSVDSARFWDREYDRLLVERAFEIMRADFEEPTWRACWAMLQGGRTAAEIGTELGLTEGAVWAAKSRVLRRLREELRGLLDG
jgi:RNA polymerase sigma-70 factor, ECF subfamily